MVVFGHHDPRRVEIGVWVEQSSVRVGGNWSVLLALFVVDLNSFNVLDSCNLLADQRKRNPHRTAPRNAQKAEQHDCLDRGRDEERGERRHDKHHVRVDPQLAHVDEPVVFQFFHQGRQHKVHGERHNGVHQQRESPAANSFVEQLLSFVRRQVQRVVIPVFVKIQFTNVGGGVEKHGEVADPGEKLGIAHDLDLLWQSSDRPQNLPEERLDCGENGGMFLVHAHVLESAFCLFALEPDGHVVARVLFLDHKHRNGGQCEHDDGHEPTEHFKLRIPEPGEQRAQFQSSEPEANNVEPADHTRSPGVGDLLLDARNHVDDQGTA
ncbi:hypothetical protein OGAPHI_005592 [Ogataea philodendri]|uniref:Uncharacterized protein n=1 Tax=Ogataea philodendri TaxID=1378263 RepID=A0A9P8NZ19_9ASCO|nr:uncharacterized protein OGAPHI_005592 [Ogataea philodendri]KAH3662340.1 hypothetical protein OGAPHI_005592 [Ogataea philodendri]